MPTSFVTTSVAPLRDAANFAARRAAAAISSSLSSRPIRFATQRGRRVASSGNDVDIARTGTNGLGYLGGVDPAPVDRIGDLVEDDQPVPAALDCLARQLPGVLRQCLARRQVG